MICVIYDRTGFDKKKHFDDELMKKTKELVGMLQDFYAERLAVMYILNVNWFFRVMYAMMKPFLTKRTTDKVRLFPLLQSIG